MADENKKQAKSNKRNVNKEARKINAKEGVILFLEYLKRNTDKDHKIHSIRNIQGYFGERGLTLGNDTTVNTLVQHLAAAYNTDTDERVLPQSEWRIVFDDYIKKYGDLSEEDLEESEEEEEEPDDKGRKGRDGTRIKNLYYAHAFSQEDMDALVEAILFSRTIGEADADRMIKTLEEHFASKYYRKASRGIHKIHEKSTYDKELLQKNLRIIQQAIEDDVQIEYRFNGYSHDKKLKLIGNHKKGKAMISPYYIVADYGRYYLLGANDYYKNMMTIRIDLMTEVQIAAAENEKNPKGKPRIPIEEVENMPGSWDENFSYQHLKMAYDAPRKITLRIKSEKDEQGRHIDPDYTFLHDNFGDTYRYLHADEQDPNYDIVEVRCSPFAIVNMALQYADRMEILEPAGVREEVQKKARTLFEKYVRL